MSIKSFVDSKKITVTKGDYKYSRLSNRDEGWSVEAIDKFKTSYGPMESEIDGVPVTNISRTFANCRNLITAPTIPDSVKYMNGTFLGCSSLTDASGIIIPEGVTEMCATFEFCSSLTVAPKIPDSVEYKEDVFYGCNFNKTIADQVLSGNEKLSVPSGTDDKELDDHDDH